MLKYIILLIFPLVAAAQDFQANPNETTIGWTGTKVGGAHTGKISLKEGQLKMAKGKLVSGQLTVDMTSIKDEDLSKGMMKDKLQTHLKSEDFFSVEKFPTSTLVVKTITEKGKGEVEITGDLTIKGKSAPVTFVSSLKQNGKKLTADGKITFDRTVYDIRYGSGKFFPSLGDKLIHDPVTLDIHLVAETKEKKTSKK